MGLLDSVVGMMTGQQPGAAGGNAALLQAVVGLLTQNGSGGGLADLVARFQQGGLGDVVSSWVSTGQNLPVSAEQLQSVLGPGTIGQIAQQLGLSHGEAATQLSQLLPQVVDHLTPQGVVTNNAQAGLGEIGALLARFGAH